MIQIAICDDSEVTLQHLDQAVTTILQSNQEVADITLYSKSENLSYDIKEGHFFDLILTDIEMPHMNGMELAATIRTHLPGALIIFITAYTKYALDAFELSAFRYIDKEMIPEKLPTAIKDAFRILHMQADQYYLLSNTRMYRKLLLKDILYISREGKNSVFHLTNQTEVKERKSLNPVMEELNSSDFVFADRGIIVNLIHIVSIQDTTIELDNGEFLPASLARIKELKLLLLFAVLLFEIDLRNRQHLLEKEALSKHLLEEKYQNLNEVYSQNARLYHDLNNHLIALDHLLDDGNISEAKTYIAAIQKPVQILKKTHWTGADVVDAVLNNKIQLLCNTDCFTISNVSEQLENIFSKTVDKSRHVMYIKEVRVAR